MLGALLRGLHAGDAHLACNTPALRAAPDSITLTSTAFSPNGPIALRCIDGALGGGDASPALSWTAVPPGTAELVVIAQDPDAPLPRPVVHMIVTGIPPDWTSLPERTLPPPATPGRVSFGKIGYIGPKPPKGHGPHRYIFLIVAADQALGLTTTPTLKAVLHALTGHALAKGQVTGTYQA